MKEIIERQSFDQERAFYNVHNLLFAECHFEGPADGESCLKECSNIEVQNSEFKLRYPLWHVHTFTLENIHMYDTCRAALWYCSEGTISDSKLHGIKALRECDHITMNNCDVISPEFGWKCRDLNITNTKIESEYLFFECSNLTIDNLNMKGKYSFQYVKNMTITNSVLDTKDAFWHSENVTVINSTIKGEYLAWYAKNLTLINCTIIGTQPLCYDQSLILQDCKMIDCDLSFEYSDVTANIKGEITSVKNPTSGKIIADKINEIILEDSVKPLNAEIIDLSKK